MIRDNTTSKQMPSYSAQVMQALVEYDIQMKGIKKKKILKWMSKNYGGIYPYYSY